ncbi:hypothetical protein ACWGVR_27635 [Streptomyces xanthophaeus]
MAATLAPPRIRSTNMHGWLSCQERPWEGVTVLADGPYFGVGDVVTFKVVLHTSATGNSPVESSRQGIQVTVGGQEAGMQSVSAVIPWAGCLDQAPKGSIEVSYAVKSADSTTDSAPTRVPFDFSLPGGGVCSGD